MGYRGIASSPARGAAARSRGAALTQSGWNLGSRDVASGAAGGLSSESQKIALPNRGGVG